MKELFISKTKLDARCLSEINWRAYSYVEKRHFLLQSAILFFCLFSAVIGALIFAECPLSPLVLGLAFTAALVLTVIDAVFFAHWIAAKKECRQYRKKHGVPFLSQTCSVSQHKVQVYYEEIQEQFERSLDQITSYDETKNYFLLFGPTKKLFCVLDKSGFILGNAHDFRALVKENFPCKSKKKRTN